MSSPVMTAPRAGSPEPWSWRTMPAWQRAMLGVVLLELGVLYAPTVAWLWERWTMSVWHNAHGLLIPLVVGYFIHQELRTLQAAPAVPSRAGFLILIPALALQALDAGMHTELLAAATIPFVLIGLSLLMLGQTRTKAILIPLLFLMFALPIPLALTEQIHWQLRLIVTAAVAGVVPLLGIPVFAEGTNLHLSRGVLEVADACSGFSTLYAATAVACLTAYSTPSTVRRALVLIVAAPLAIASNILRVILLTVLVVWQGGWVLESYLHPLSGMMTFALALPIIFWLGGDMKRMAAS